MTQFISNLIGNNEWATFIMSIFPLIELKGGIVFARSAGLDFICSFILAYIGSSFAFFPIYFLLRPILDLMKKIKWFDKLAVKVENHFNKKAQKTLNNRQNKQNAKNGKIKSVSLLKQLGVFIFVAIPLPMTGVWTGTAIAVFLNLSFKEAVLPVLMGNAVAGLIIAILASLCIAIWDIAVLDYILYALFLVALIILIMFILKAVLKKSDN